MMQSLLKDNKSITTRIQRWRWMYVDTSVNSFVCKQVEYGNLCNQSKISSFISPKNFSYFYGSTFVTL